MISCAFLVCLSVPIPVHTTVIRADVHFGQKGPFRMLVDTGATSTVIDPQLAEELRLTPTFRTELVNLHGSRLVPGAKTDLVRIADRHFRDLEVLICDPEQAKRGDASIRGVLGMNALSQFDFLLLPAEGRLEIGGPRPAGRTMPFTTEQGRIAVSGTMGSESLSLVLDSGASHVVLFRRPAAMKKTGSIPSTMNTLDGARSTVPTVWTSDLYFAGDVRVTMLPAAIVQQRARNVDGLMPVSPFGGVYVDQARREVVLVAADDAKTKAKVLSGN